MARLVVRLGREPARAAYSSRPCDRRTRQRATRCATLEPPRLRQQRHRGLLRRRALISATALRSQLRPPAVQPYERDGPAEEGTQMRSDTQSVMIATAPGKVL